MGIGCAIVARLSPTLAYALVTDDEYGDNRQFLRRFSCRQLSMSLPYLVRDIISTVFSARARYKLSCDLILQFH